MIYSTGRFLENNDPYSISKRLLTFSLIGIILFVSASGVLVPQAKAKSGGLKVFVHVTGGGGNVCVRTASEDAGCKSLSGPGTAKFEFSPDVVAVGQKFTACIDQTCTTGTNSAAKKPENVYLSSSKGVGSNIVTPQPQLQQQQQQPPQTTTRINWKGMCSAVQSALYSSCDTLVNSDGTLSPEGERAWICIRNGGALALGAMALGVSPTATISGLTSLSNPTTCGNIVNFKVLPSIPNLKTIINLIPDTIASNSLSR
jgi:hypothetical protein